MASKPALLAVTSASARRLDNGAVHIEIANLGAIVPLRTTKVGLVSTRKRLALALGANAQLDLSENSGWVRATLTLRRPPDAGITDRRRAWRAPNCDACWRRILMWKLWAKQSMPPMVYSRSMRSSQTWFSSTCKCPAAAADMLEALEEAPEVIFTTAFDHYACRRLK
jgi:hypothetical protein